MAFFLLAGIAHEGSVRAEVAHSDRPDAFDTQIGNGNYRERGIPRAVEEIESTDEPVGIRIERPKTFRY